ncbi:TRAP transporter large permease [Anaeromicrobium sediminis]|uniref:C4-dicarboxylate ABC transporter n=1 Tax=Anaeromicrobium sediminis TaxID=1478221 RepID=A0A267MNP1_9FIRM|nr:TRAP transporter large permease [Anaeromicrobium sediminis]PAB61037.1 C4-dicarboxylate ABC transporter [Anaeromicrobium sediminis]
MILLLVGLVLCLVIGVPIAYSLGVSGLAYFLVYRPELLTVLPQRLFAGLNSYSMIALPLFILMGQLMNDSGITDKIINFSNLIFGKVKGGLGCINVFASMIFGGISGSSASDTASIGAILIPEMEKRGYDKEFAAGITVASSTMGMIIPPSVPMVLYCVTAEQSVGKLFLGGLIPGVLIGLSQLIINIVISYKRNYPKEDFVYSWDYVWSITRQSLLALIMPIFIVGTVVLGIATANESASFGVMYAIFVGLFIFRCINPRNFPKLFLHAIKTSSSIMAIIAISQLYIWILSLEGVPQALAAFVVSMNLAPALMLIAIMIIILLAGTFIDVSPAILLLTPVFLPAAMSVGISPVQFGALLISGLAVGAVTPPVGTCLNVAAAISDMEIGRIFKGAVPFLIGNVIVLLLVCLFPAITTYLPELLVR